MIIKTSTWNRDSCELYDYENTDYNNCTHLIKKNSYLTRSMNQTEITNKYYLNLKENYLLNVNFDENENFIQKDIDNKFTKEKVWITLRHYNSSKYEQNYFISEGEIIKVGRIKIKIKYIVTQKQKQNSRNEHNKLNYTKLKQNSRYDFDSKTDMNFVQQTIMKKRNPVCRICYCDESELESPLLNPCKCSGGVKYIHLSCLQQWLKSKSVMKNVSDSHCVTYTLKQIECELCKTILPDVLKSDQNTFDIWDFLKPNFSNYLVMETLNDLQNTDTNTNTLTNTKTLYMLNFDEKEILKLGRSNDSDIKISDISVSRFHCFFQLWRNGEVSLCDNKSKFGTLVLLNHPFMPVYFRLCLPLQIGRTLCRIQLKNPTFIVRLFTCWKPQENVKDYCALNAEFILKEDILNVKVQAEMDSVVASDKSLNYYNLSNNNKTCNGNDNFNNSNKNENLNHEINDCRDKNNNNNDDVDIIDDLNKKNSSKNSKENIGLRTSPPAQLTITNNINLIGNLNLNSPLAANANLTVKEPNNFSLQQQQKYNNPILHVLETENFSNLNTLGNNNNNNNNNNNDDNDNNYNSNAIFRTNKIITNENEFKINNNNKETNYNLNKQSGSKSLKNCPSILNKDALNIKRNINNNNYNNNNNNNTMINIHKNSKSNKTINNYNNNINRESDDFQLKYECNTSFNQVLSANEEDTVVQLPLPAAVNKNFINVNSINNNKNNNFHFSEMNKKNAKANDNNSKNFKEPLKSNFIQPATVDSLEQSIQKLNLPSAQMNPFAALDIVELNPNYIPNLAAYNNFNNNEIDKIRNFALIGDLLNNSISTSKNINNLFLNKNLQNKQNLINNNNINNNHADNNSNNDTINHNNARKSSFNYDLRGNLSSVFYDVPYNNFYKNVISNHNHKNNFYEMQMTQQPHPNDEEYYSRVSYKNAAFSNSVSPVNYNRNRNYSSYISRKKSAKNKSPKIFFNKKFDEDQIKILNGNSNKNNANANVNVNANISTNNFINASHSNENNVYRIFSKNKTPDCRPVKSIIFGNNADHKHYTSHVNNPPNPVYNRVINRDLILDPLNLIGENDN